MDTVAMWDGRMSRFRDTQIGQMAEVRDQQERFQTEMREIIAGYREEEDDAGYSIRKNREGEDTSEPHERGKGGNWRYRKIEMPLFEGGDPDGWILRSEKYFKVCRLTKEEEKVDAAVVALKGEALQWYQWQNGQSPVVSWEDLKARIHQQFRPASGGSLHVQWLATVQTTTVMDYSGTS